MISMESGLTWEEFSKVDIRVGTVMTAEVFPEARKPAYKLCIDFGPLGKKMSSAQITDQYQPQDLVDRQIIAVVNFPPKQIANMMSECLVLGVYGEDQIVTLLAPDRSIQNGLKIG